LIYQYTTSIGMFAEKLKSTQPHRNSNCKPLLWYSQYNRNHNLKPCIWVSENKGLKERQYTYTTIAQKKGYARTQLQ